MTLWRGRGENETHRALSGNSTSPSHMAPPFKALAQALRTWRSDKGGKLAALLTMSRESVTAAEGEAPPGSGSAPRSFSFLSCFSTLLTFNFTKTLFTPLNPICYNKNQKSFKVKKRNEVEFCPLFCFLKSISVGRSVGRSPGSLGR